MIQEKSMHYFDPTLERIISESDRTEIEAVCKSMPLMKNQHSTFQSFLLTVSLAGPFIVWALLAPFLFNLASPIWFVCAMFLIGGPAYHRLTILIHHLSHFAVFSTKQKNNFAGFLFSALAFTNFKGYVIRHTLHHKFSGTSKDPEGYFHVSYRKASLFKKA